MRTRTLVGASLLALASAFARDASADAPRVVDRIVAIVDHEPLLMSDLVTQSAPEVSRANAMGGAETALSTIYRAVLDRMIDDLLIEDEARKMHVEVSTDEIDRAFDSMSARVGAKTKAEFLTMIAAQGLDELTYRRMIRAQILEYKVLSPAIAAARDATTPAAIAERLAALKAKDPKATQADAEESLRNDVYNAARERRMGELHRAHFIEVRL